MSDFLRIIFKIEPKYPSFASNLFIEVLKDENYNFYVDLVFNDEIQASFDFNFFKNQIITKSWSDEEIAKYCDFPDFERYITIKNTYLFFFFDFLIFS